MAEATFLARILEHKRQEVRARKAQIAVRELESRIADQHPAKRLADAIRRPQTMAVIAELKKASPSAGILREDFEPEIIAGSYIEAGADALSVLTDEDFFLGSLAYLETIRPASPIPLLRKDFLIDSHQIYESRAAGADAVLLIVAALAPTQLVELLECSASLGMDALVEVHDEGELESAVSAGAAIIGINNRNLASFDVDLGTTERLAPRVPKQIPVVAESGIRSLEDLKRVADAGAQAVLVGTHFMRHNDPGMALASFKKGISSCFA